MDYRKYRLNRMEKLNKLLSKFKRIKETEIKIITNFKKQNTMILDLITYSCGKNDTLGLFFVDGVFQCYTIEDEYRTVKVPGKTCIPDGEYDVKLRSEGGYHNKYLAEYGSTFHKGMLCIHNDKDWKITLPSMSFQYILFHVGNNEAHTDGCVLWANTSKENLSGDGFIGDSKTAYKRVYPIIRDALLKGESVKLRKHKLHPHVLHKPILN